MIKANGRVTFEGRAITTVAKLHDDRDWIHPLWEQLEIHRNNWMVTHPAERFEGKLIVASDANTDSKTLSKVTYLAAMAGFHHTTFRMPSRTSE